MDQIKIGKFIASCRKEQGMTQAILAEKLGISDRTMSKWETGKSMKENEVEKAVRLLSAFGNLAAKEKFSMNYLLRAIIKGKKARFQPLRSASLSSADSQLRAIFLQLHMGVRPQCCVFANAVDWYRNAGSPIPPMNFLFRTMRLP